MRVADWAVFLIYLAITIFVGLWSSRRGKDLDAYYLGNRSLPWWAVGLSVMATQASAITFIGTTGQAYNDGMRFLQVYLPLPIVVVILCLVFVPFFYKARVYTAYEYLERRFDPKTRALTSLLFQCSRGMSVGIVLYAPSVVLSVILGWDERFTILIMGMTTLLYTAKGGVRAVVWTDTIQMLLMFFGVFFGLGLILWYLPSNVTLSDAVYLGGIAGRWNAIDTSLNLNDRYTLLSGLVGGFFLMLAYFGSDQSQVQRYITAKSLRESRMSLVLTGVLKVPMQFLILGTGVLLLVFFQFERPPLFFNPSALRQIQQSGSSAAFEEKQVAFDAAFDRQRALNLQLLEQRRNGGGENIARIRSDVQAASADVRRVRGEAIDLVRKETGASDDVNYIYLNFLVNYVPRGLLGLMISVIFAAAMSSISAEIAALSSATMIDFYKRFFRPEDTDAHYLRAGQIITVFWGLFATLIAFFAGRGGASLIETVNQVGSHFYGPILGVFLLAFMVPRAGGDAAFVGVIVGMLSVFTATWITPSWLYYNVIGATAVLASGGLLSLARARRVY